MPQLWPALGNMFKGLGFGLASLSGVSAVAADVGKLAAAGRALSLVTGVGLALAIGYEVVTHWQQIAVAAERLWTAISKIKGGNVSGGLKNTGSVVGDVNKKLGNIANPAPLNQQLPSWLQLPDSSKRGVLDDLVDATARAYKNLTDPHVGRLDNQRYNAHRAGNALGAFGPHYGDTRERMTHAQDVIAKAQQATRVNVTVAPIQVNSKVDVKVSGQVNAPLQGTATVSSAATAPRGAATAEGSYGHAR
jgi:hypothetical protein